MSSSEGRAEGCHLIENTPKRPDVTFAVVWLVLPDLGRGIVRCTCLGVQHAFLCNLRDVEISKLNDPILCHEHIGTLDVSVADFIVVESLESFDYLSVVLPDLLLTE